MRELLDLFEEVFGARKTDPVTSHEAARINKELKRRDRYSVLGVHYDHSVSGLTDFELASILRRQQTSVGKRRGELRDLGMIEQTDKRRKAPSGASAIVWRITEAGKRFVKKG
jgi:hypothetical protein